MIEEWRPIRGYEGIYDVSSHGRVRSLPRVDCVGRRRKGKIILTNLATAGYPKVMLQDNRTRVTRLIHILVAEAFLGARPEEHTVNHIDGNKANNLVTNIEWATLSQQQLHRYRVLKKGAAHGETHCCAKLTERQVVGIRDRWANGAGRRGVQTRLALDYGVTLSNIRAIVDRRTWKCVSEGAMR